MKTGEYVFLIAVAVMAAAVVFTSLRATEEAFTVPALSAVPAGGTVRDVDMGRINRLIEQGYLSDREAEYYEQMPSDRQAAEQP